MENVKVVKFGLGEVTSNWGTFEGRPAVFIEPVEAAGVVGEKAPDTPRDSVASGGVILQFHGASGAQVLMQDILTALMEGSHTTPNADFIGKTVR